jgi:hypothetical protein
LKDPKRKREWRDFTTHNVWKDMLTELGQMEAREIGQLIDITRQGTIEEIKHQAGVIDGIQRTIKFLINKAEQARNT